MLVVDCALLCDAATVREGLLNVLGGGVTTTTFDRYPAPLPVTLALRLSGDSVADFDHAGLVVTLLDDSQGVEAARLDLPLQLQPSPTPPSPGERVSIALALPLSGLELRNEGRYFVEAVLGEAKARLPLEARQSE